VQPPSGWFTINGKKMSGTIRIVPGLFVKQNPASSASATGSADTQSQSVSRIPGGDTEKADSGPETGDKKNDTGAESTKD